MTEQIRVRSGVEADFDIRDGEVRLTRVASPGDPWGGVDWERALGPVELHVAGDEIPRGHRNVGNGATRALRYVKHDISQEPVGAYLRIVQLHPARGITVESHFQFFDDVAAVRAWSTATNGSELPVTVLSLSALTLSAITEPAPDEWAAGELAIAHNTFCTEYRWVSLSLRDRGLVDTGLPLIHGLSTTGRVRLSSSGSQPTIEYLPMGALEISGRSMIWQVEQNGSWEWELGDYRRGLYLSLAGPIDAQQWHAVLEPGDALTTPRVALALGLDGRGALFGDLTRYRRLVQQHPLGEHPPVVFNDYMNCLMADPTEEKLRPIIARAAEVGAEIFCIDAGWYSDATEWGDDVGDWVESSARFPSGLATVCGWITAAGMRPGLWLEPEVIGRNADLTGLAASDVFQRSGERTNGGGGRYQLDFGSEAVRRRLDAAVDRLVADYGLGYFKFDYNINTGPGADGLASVGERLQRSQAGYLEWVAGVYDRHPGIILENCSSGGARADGASMSVFSTMSASDQNDYRLTAPIAANVATAAPPEQCGVWVYPAGDMSSEETMFSIVNGMLASPQLSGSIWSLSAEQLTLLSASVAHYKSIRSDLTVGVPTWPTGLAQWDSQWISRGVRVDGALHLAVWRRGGAASIDIDLAAVAPAGATRVSVFPSEQEGFSTDLSWDADARRLSLTLDSPISARLFTIS